MGSMLMAAGLKSGECPETWNVAHEADVRAIHRAYLDAGADIILTNTFGGNRFVLKGHGLESRLAELNRAGATLARAVAHDAAKRLGRDTFVLGDLGPTGRFLAPLGTDSFDDFLAAFKEQAAALAQGGVDGLVIETMTSVEEVEAAIKAAKAAMNLPVAASMTFQRDTDGKGYHTIMGVDVATMVKRLEDAGADILGTNCGQGIEQMIGVVRQMRDLTAKPILVEPNAGLPRLSQGRTVYAQTPEEMVQSLDALLDAGASIVGGCCGTTPKHIRLIAERIKSRRSR
jgi:5-methyltetrahydrofolate--homocysteine methyltransferase